MGFDKGSWPAAPELRDIRREVIRDEAARLFVLNGYRSTTLDQIAANLGVTKGAIYHYFKSKDEILHAIVLVAMEAMEENFNLVSQSQADIGTKIYRILRGHVLAVVENRNSLGVFLREQREMGDLVRWPIEHRMREYTNSVAHMVETIQIAQGNVVVDPVVVVFAWFSSCNSVIQWYSPDGPLTPETIADMLAGMALRSIGIAPTSVDISYDR